MEMQNEQAELMAEQDALAEETDELTAEELKQVAGGRKMVYFYCKECGYQTFDFNIGAGKICPDCGDILRPHLV